MHRREELAAEKKQSKLILNRLYGYTTCSNTDNYAVLSDKLVTPETVHNKAHLGGRSNVVL